MQYKFTEVDSKELMGAIDDMIGIACSLNSQNYENLIKMRHKFQKELETMYKIETLNREKRIPMS